MRPSIYPGKTERVQGTITKEGKRGFERARLELANRSGWALEDCSDADTIDYLARGRTLPAGFKRRVQ